MTVYNHQMSHSWFQCSRLNYLLHLTVHHLTYTTPSVSNYCTSRAFLKMRVQYSFHKQRNYQRLLILWGPSKSLLFHLSSPILIWLSLEIQTCFNHRIQTANSAFPETYRCYWYSKSIELVNFLHFSMIEFSL